MDTDDLSKATYKGILIEAEKFHPDLTLRFGLIAYECEDEAEYLTTAKELCEELKEMDEDEIDDFFFGQPPPNAKKNLTAALKRILENISKLLIGTKRHLLPIYSFFNQIDFSF